MAETDSPLKDLLREFAPDFAAWLLNVARADIRDVHQETIELPAGKVFSDTVYHVTLANGQRPLLHVEFQGERSERPMRWRMLDYMSRLAQVEELAEAEPLCSAVIYVGDGAGARDTGDYRLLCADGSLSLAWRYRVIRLWQMRAEELLALGRPALLPLVGQTRIEDPERIVPQAVAAIGQVDDDEDRGRLLAAFTSLLRDEEVIQMAERLMEAMDQGLLMDTPFLRRIRTESETRGEVRGELRGEAKGRIEELRTIILDVLATRLNPSLAAYRRIEARVAAINEIEQLRKLVQTVVSAANATEFEQALAG